MFLFGLNQVRGPIAGRVAELTIGGYAYGAGAGSISLSREDLWR